MKLKYFLYVYNYKKAKKWFGKAYDSENQDGCDNYTNLNKQGY